MKIRISLVAGTLTALLSLATPQAPAAEPPASAPSPAEQVVQVDVSELLNARAVTTFSNGKLVTWTKGIDGGGRWDGYLTMAASLHVGDKNPKALPDDPLIPASGSRPEMLLHYSNDEGMKNQTRAVANGEFTIPVARRHYRGMFLAFTSSEGPSPLQFELTYADGTSEQRKATIPDYFFDIPADDPHFSYVLRDLAKWGPKNQMTEAKHHNIHAYDVAPDATKELISVKVTKVYGGYLVFWGATGVAVDTQPTNAR